MAILNGTKHADTINGTAGDDRIFGDNGNDALNGGAGNDIIDGGNGSDLISGGAGDDEIDGGNGHDTVVLAGNRAQYHLTQRADGSIVVRDLRAGSPEGADRLVSIERVQFADGTFKIADLISTAAAPVAGNDQLTLAENAGATEVTAILLANDSDADADAFSITAVQAVSAQGATVTLAPDGKVSYDPGSLFADLDNGQTATDSFTYTITDSAGLTSTATATVTITGVTQNTAPAAANDTLTIAEDAGATDVTATLLANDSDADGDALAVTAVQAVSAKGATVTLSADGKVFYNAGQIFDHLGEGQKATDTFTYTVTDVHGAVSTATATVTITGVEIVPDAFFYVLEDGTSENMLGSIIEFMGLEPAAVETDGLLGTLNFDLDAGILEFTADHASSDPLHPEVQQWTYFTVVGTEGERKLIGMLIQGVNDDAIAVDDAVAVGEGQTSANLWSGLIGNDIDPDNGPTSRHVRSVDTTGTLGTVSFDAATRTVTYSAAGIDLAPGETITDSFTYGVSDTFFGGNIDFGMVTVTVTGAGGVAVSAAPAMSAFAAEGWDLSGEALASFAAMQPEILGAELPIA